MAIKYLLNWLLNCSRRAPVYFTLVGDKASPAARNSSEVARALNWRCYPHTGNGGLIWFLSSSLSLSVDVAWSTPQGLTTMRTLFICSLNWELTKEHGVDGAPGKAYTNSVTDQHSLYPGRQHTLAFFTKCATPVEQELAVHHIMPPFFIPS